MHCGGHRGHGSTGQAPTEGSDMTMTEAVKPMALRSRDAAKALNISERTLWQYTKDGLIPCKRVGQRKTKMYSVVALEAWLAGGTAPVEAAPF